MPINPEQFPEQFHAAAQRASWKCFQHKADLIEWQDGDLQGMRCPALGCGVAIVIAPEEPDLEEEDL